MTATVIPFCGPGYSANSCFLDALVVALFHAPPPSLRRHLRSGGDVGRELQALSRGMREEAETESSVSSGMTCTALRSCLRTAMQARGYEDPGDGQPRDAGEVAKALFALLELPDVLAVQSKAEIQVDGEWLLRDHPATRLHGLVWSVRMPSSARTLAATMHVADTQEVDGELEPQDVAAMQRLHGRSSLPRRYSRRRETLRLVNVRGGDFFVVELMRLYHDGQGRMRRSEGRLAPDTIQIGEHAWHAVSLLCHAGGHYTCLVRRADAWWHFDDRRPCQLVRCNDLAACLSNVVLMLYVKKV